LVGIGLGEYKEKFKKESIIGSDLIEIDDNMLKKKI
jgi:hypothetical protein